MSVMINVHDDLARRLQVEANHRGVTVEELAIAILECAAPDSNGGKERGQRNQRRLALIRKSSQSALSEHEQAELDQLQSWLDERFESFDAGLLDYAREMKQAVARLSAGQPHE